MRFRDKIGPLHDPILKPAILPDFLAVARTLQHCAEKDHPHCYEEAKISGQPGKFDSGLKSIQSRSDGGSQANSTVIR